MEDELFVSPGCDFAGVFDGHGGAKVSNYLRRNVYSRFLQELQPGSGNKDWSIGSIKRALRCALKRCDDEVGLLKHWDQQGSTVSIVFIRRWLGASASGATEGIGDHDDYDDDGDDVDDDDDDDNNNNKEDDYELDKGKDAVVCMNLGDSRAVLARDGIALELSKDHKPDRPDERDRIEKLGGVVQWHGLLKNSKPLIGAGCYRMNGNLALSRSAGDRYERPFLSAVPDLTSTVLKETDEFVCLATDGLWDVFDSQELVSFVLSCKNAALSDSRADLLPFGGLVDRREVFRAVSLFNKRAAAQGALTGASRLGLFHRIVPSLVIDAASRRGSSDNISCVIVWFK